MNDRVVVWYSCGAASAVAAKLALDEYGSRRVVVAYCDLAACEHPDSQRFLCDCEQWLGCDIIKLAPPKYRHIHHVFRGERYIVGPSGAPCSKWLKQKTRLAFQRPGDIHVFGMAAEEEARADRLEHRHGDMEFAWPLIEGNITKPDCFKMIQQAGITLPEMYRLGYRNNNCVGCVKGGMGYWNKIRRDFPRVFGEMAALEREIGATVLRRDGARLFLDELPPDAGTHVPPDISCGLWCETGEAWAEQARQEAEKGPRRITLAEARDQALATGIEAEERYRKFADDEAEKEQDG